VGQKTQKLNQTYKLNQTKPLKPELFLKKLNQTVWETIVQLTGFVSVNCKLKQKPKNN
jgi:hypothetical protein